MPAAYPQSMNLRNYTSEVPAERTIGNIESRLAAAGASGISKLYGINKRVTSIVFHIDLGNRQISIRVPANVGACFETMWKEYSLKHRRYQEGAKARLMAQAERTAWRIVEDWIDVQISMIHMKQAEFLEVFLPYVWDGKQTLFETTKAGGFKALPERTDYAKENQTT